MRAASLLVILLLCPSLLDQDSLLNDQGQLVVWNIGQGSWATWISERACVHFDMGGEFAPWSKIRKACSGKRNWLNISHLDRDHINFISDFQRRVATVCSAQKIDQGGKETTAKRFVKSLKDCRSDLSDKRLRDQVAQRVSWHPSKKLKTRNDLSEVFVLRGVVLFPGDASTRAERVWGAAIKQKIKILILGHHGSRTATSELMLSQLPSIKMAIASQRQRVYGHPHPQVVVRLRRRGIPVLKTEDWGTIGISLPYQFGAIGAVSNLDY